MHLVIIEFFKMRKVRIKVRMETFIIRSFDQQKCPFSIGLTLL